MSATRPIWRKRKYVDRFASIPGVHITISYWSLLQPLIHGNIADNLVFRLLLDMYLCLLAHMDYTQFDFNSDVNFYEIFVELYEPRPFTPPKGTVDDRDIERMLWDLRQRLLHRQPYYVEKTGLTAETLIREMKDFLVSRGAEEWWVDYIVTLLAQVAGKMMALCVVGLATVGTARVAPPTYEVYLPPRFEEKIDVENVYVLESPVGIARVGYARVIKKPGSLEPEVMEVWWSRVDEHLKRQSTIASSPEYVFYPRVFFWQRVPRLHLKGGHHQIMLQNITNIVKRVCDKHGIIGPARTTYQNFALELKYKDYPGHEKETWWRRLMTPEEVIEKYVKRGCEKAILEEIRTLLGV